MKALLENPRVRRALAGWFFAAALSVALCLSMAHAANAPETPARAQVTREIKEFARRHVDLGMPLSTSAVITTFHNNQAGISDAEVADIYEREYAAKKESVLYALAPKAGWILAILVFVALIFRDQVSRIATTLLDAVQERTYARFSGSRAFRNSALRRYRTRIADRYNVLPLVFRPNRPLDLRKVFVPLAIGGGAQHGPADAVQACIQNRRLMVVGQPGSGKSILLKRLAVTYANGGLDSLPDRPIAILLELRRLNQGTDAIEDLLTGVLERNDFPNAGRLIERSLNEGKLLLLLDGFDEVTRDNRPAVAQRINDFLEKYGTVRAVITCRSEVYDGEFLSTLPLKADLIGFSDPQILAFLRPWGADMPEGKSVEQLISALRDRPRIMALARNPLLLTIIAFLYTDTETNLPHSRAEFYQQATNILLRQWQEQLNHFPARSKAAILRQLALLHQDGTLADKNDPLSMKYDPVVERVRKMMPQLNISESENPAAILDEIIERSGLMLRVDGRERLQFSHLTLREYFAAEALLDDGPSLVARFAGDPGNWRETVKLWCGSAPDSTALIQQIADIELYTGFECLADAIKVDAATATAIIDRVKPLLPRAAADTEIARAFASVASESHGGRGRQVLIFLESMLTAPDPEVRLGAATALSMTNLPYAVNVLGANHDAIPNCGALLVRMGDLAVRNLKERAATGQVDAVANLGSIGTPAAAAALSELLAQGNTLLQTESAWQLAALLAKPGIPEALNGLGPNVLPLRAAQFDWVWRPFAGPADSPLHALVTRICALISAGGGTGTTASDVVDERIAMPLVIKWMAESGTSWDRAVEWLGSTPLARDLFEVGPVRRLSDTLRAKGISPADGSPQMTEAERRRLLNEWLERMHAPGWVLRLFASLPYARQIDLIARMAGAPKRFRQRLESSWANIFRLDPYSFDRGWQFRTILVFGLLVSLATAALIGADLWSVLTNGRHTLAALDPNGPVRADFLISLAGTPWLVVIEILAIASILVSWGLFLTVGLDSEPKMGRPSEFVAMLVSIGFVLGAFLGVIVIMPLVVTWLNRKEPRRIAPVLISSYMDFLANFPFRFVVASLLFPAVLFALGGEFARSSASSPIPGIVLLLAASGIAGLCIWGILRARRKDNRLYGILGEARPVVATAALAGF